MISINSLKINELASLINLQVSTAVGNKITKVLLWNIDTFKDYTKAVDLSSLITSTSEKEELVIPASKLNSSTISGLYFVEVTSNETIVPTNTNQKTNVALGVVANYTKYHECILNKVLALDIQGCKQVLEDCDNCANDVLFLNVLLTTLNNVTQFGYYQEAIDIIRKLEDLCEDCTDCNTYGTTKLLNGLGFGTVDDTIILI